MGKVLLEEQSLIDIANSIRNKTNSTDTMKPSEMATNIDNIESGEGDLSEYFTETIKGGSTNTPGFCYMIKKIPKVKNEGKDNSYMFNYFNGTEIDLSEFDTSEVTSMERMFGSCKNLTNIDVSNFNTENVTTMRNMFQICQHIESLDLSNFNTSKVTNMSGMFDNCKLLSELNISNFNTENVTTMNNMFYQCENLISLDLSNFNTGKVTTMSNMFGGCKNLTSLDLSGWNTSKVTNMSSMFNNCVALTHLDIRNFDFTNVTSYSSMFGASNGPADNCLIIVKDETAKEWVTSKFTRLTNVKTIAEYESGV